MLKRLVLVMVVSIWMAAAPSRVLAADAPHPITEHAAVAGSHGEAEKPGILPDFSSSETYMQALWVVIIFVVMLAILYPTAWKNVLAGLKAREERIRRDIAEAEEARTKAESTLRDYTQQLNAAQEKVRQMINQATADGERVATNIRTHAQQEAEEIKERANRDIETAKNNAISEIYEQAAGLATSVAEKILEDEAKYEVEVAKGGFAAGVIAEKFRPHVILLDMHLATIDAREVCKQVKSSADLQLTKVISMSEKLTDEEAKALMGSGFDGFLQKPFHVRQVIEAIEDAMAVVY
jgi:F-type H+-transporting ATPase subunit b